MDIQKEWDLFVAHLRTLGVVKIGRNALGVITNLMREGNCSLGYNDIELMWETWQVRAQAVPEGFVLVPTKNIKYFSNDGENYEIHNTLAEAKHEAECAIEHFSERLADQLSDPRSDGNFNDVGYGIVLAQSAYSIDHIVTQDDIDNGDYSYEVGTEIMSLFLVEVQEPAPLKLGDLVEPIDHRYTLASGCERYPYAYVVNTNPFQLMSEEGDMYWCCTVEAGGYKLIKSNDQLPEAVSLRMIREGLLSPVETQEPTHD